MRQEAEWEPMSVGVRASTLEVMPQQHHALPDGRTHQPGSGRHSATVLLLVTLTTLSLLQPP